MKVQEKQKSPPLQADFTVPEQEKTSVCDVFCAHYSELVNGITEPTPLVIELFSKCLVSKAVRTWVTTVTGADNTERSVMIVNELESLFENDSRIELIEKFCDVIKQFVALQPVALSIRKALGGLIMRQCYIFILKFCIVYRYTSFSCSQTTKIVSYPRIHRLLKILLPQQPIPNLLQTTVTSY